MIVLGIETSCDETAAAILNGRAVLSNLVYSQIAEHGPFGGVVPEIAARSHVHHLDSLIKDAMQAANIDFDQLDGVAATAGPGLIGGLMVGLTMGKTIALVHKLPFVAANHLEAHALTARLTHGIAFPYLLLLASGGHCQLLVVNGVSNYQRLGTTLDDAPGEAFDKVARMLGLGYPGGPAIEELSLLGDPTRHKLPRPLKGRKGCDFSFSGLKTAVANVVAKNGTDKELLPDLCASFQEAVADVLVDRLENALALVNKQESPSINGVVLAGGVGANKHIRGHLSKRATELGVKFIAPPTNLCTDNAAMVAWAGYENISLGLVDSMQAPARPRWPLQAMRRVHLGTSNNG
ncbi:MAG: tRNA (adenosine(37)-N6)-threonylcarbamoyltransferase complex transferase subunit TsaD [Pseudomonadota bacterium]|nr:tRNA (adenosine(37)-N6)-threonylcarbamoyltransferase complex transferase subunit TsaD [Pseudomonadota bacterium]